MRAQDFVVEIGDSPAEHQPNKRRTRSLFHADVDGHDIAVFFDRSFTGTLQITFTVDGSYEPPKSGPATAAKSTVRILSTVLNIVKQRLPEYMRSARPPRVSFTAKGDSRASLYEKYFVPVVQNILGSQWQLEITGGDFTSYVWKKALDEVRSDDKDYENQL